MTGLRCFRADVGVCSISALFCYRINAAGEVTYHQTLTLNGNVLDVTVMESIEAIIVSIDNVHVPNSTRWIRSSDQTAHPNRLCAFEILMESQSYEWRPAVNLPMDAIGSQAIAFVEGDADGTGMTTLTSLLYNLENLRKHAQEEVD